MLPNDIRLVSCTEGIIFLRKVISRIKKAPPHKMSISQCDSMKRNAVKASIPPLTCKNFLEFSDGHLKWLYK